jgi:hypothetical protein
MDLDRLKGTWQASEPAAPLAVSDSASLATRLDALDRAVRRRDVREYIAACFVMAFFGWRAAVVAEPLARVGYLLVVFGAMFIIVWSRRASSSASSRAFTSDLPVAHFLRKEIEKVDAQIRLLRSVWWWYVSPTIVGLLLTLIPGSRALAIRLALAALFLGVGVAIHWLNVTTAKRELEPLRAELSARLKELEQTPEAAVPRTPR